MTTVRVYKSDLADVRLKVRWGRRHGRPRGRGRRGWVVLVRERYAVEPVAPTFVEAA